MDEVHVPAGPGMPRGLVVPSSAITERFSRSPGPGGQGVNTTDSRVQLWLDTTSLPLTDAQRRRLVTRLGSRLVDGVLVVDASEHRSQRQNRRAARERLSATLREALAPEPQQRRATRPTRGSVERRLAGKRRRSEQLALRRVRGD